MLKDKINQLRSTITEKATEINTQVAEVRELAGTDLEAAKALKAEIETKKAELKQLEEELAALEGIDAEEEVPVEERQEAKGEKRSVTQTKVVINPPNESHQAFEDFIRSQGETRDGLTTDKLGVVIPEDISTSVFELKQTDYDLSKYVTVKKVGKASGSFPVAKRNVGVLLTKEELKEIPDIETELFTDVKYNVETRAGKIAISEEAIEDTAINIVEDTKKQMKRMVTNTNNKHIMAKLMTFPKVPTAGLDGVKRVFNVDLDPALNKKVIVNQNGYNYLDTLKDAEGRYLLQPDIKAASGKSLFGAEVIVVSNAVLADGGTEEAPVYNILVGDFEQAVMLAQKNEVTAQWEKFDFYASGLSIVVRNDYQVVDADAVRVIQLTPAAPAQEAPQTESTPS
ncbi:phage major capsid protein [Terribacillus sp. 7520-G]|uniref:phage major capsid protein n=1 Tax=Terribacillus sp. 7520-G TaxID=2025389 RepID=UPI000BA7A41D|nr:phage major capsid protein [Terribacillus sp. 7520-G]PAD39811.1 phage major capsid protein [Terribacillus sp. 7520-G]